MKRRIISLFLTILMLLSLLPASIFAADDSVLKIHVQTEENGATIEKEYTEWSLTAHNGFHVKFFLHNADGTTTPVAHSDLTLPSFVQVEEIRDSDWLYLETVGAGQGAISYGNYSVAVTANLPDLGIYSAMPFDAATLVRDATIDENHTVFYIALGPELLNQGLKMTRVNDTFGPEVTGTALQQIGTVTLSADGTYATITVTDLTAEGHHHFEAVLADQNGTEQFGIGRSVHIENDMPTLLFCDLERTSTAWTPNPESTQSFWESVPGSSRIGVFCFGRKSDVAAGNGTVLSLDDLTFPDYMDADDFEDEGRTVPENAVEIWTVRFANGKESTDIVYEAADGTEYTFSVTTHLPELSFYTTTAASESGLIHGYNPFVVTETNRTFYLCPAEPDQVQVLSIAYWDEDVPADMFTVTPSVDADGNTDGRYLEVSVKDNVVVSDRFYSAMVNYRYLRHDQWYNDSYWVSVRLENGQPSLMWRHMEWDEDEMEWDPGKRVPETQLSFQFGDDMPVAFYYGTKDEMEEVDPADLTFPSDLMSTYTQEGILRIKATAYEGSGSITLKEDSKTVAAMPVTVRKPDFGFYSSTTASAAAHLGSTIEVDSKNDTFYVVTDGESTIYGIEAIYGGEPHADLTDYFTVEISADGSYAVIRAKDTDGNLAMGGRYELRLRQTRGTRYLQFELVRMDLDQLSTPYDLHWHKMYDWDDQVTDRMGMMAFHAGELTQNRYTVEIYSSMDGYKSPILESTWRFGDMNDADYRSVTDFIYDDLDSGTYKFRAKALGDGTKYRSSEWSELSEAWTYTKSSTRLTAPAAADLGWDKADSRYVSTWTNDGQTGAGYYEVNWFYEDPDTGKLRQNGGNFDIDTDDIEVGERFMINIHDEILQEIGNVPYYFRVRVIPADITQYRLSLWSDLSPALDTTQITDDVNDKLDALIPNTSAGQQTTVDDVQNTLLNDTADLRLAMAADLEISGGASSGTLEKIKELEQTVADNVDQKVEVTNNSVPQNIQDIAQDIEMVGATLNLADKNPENGKNPTVTLEIGVPKKNEEIIIPEQQHNAVQFTMKLNGAVDKNDEEQAGQQLIVPVVIDMPVPEGINPFFLVVLHKLWDGTVEQMRPHIYWSEAENRYRATFVIDSFSVFALLEYNFAFEQESVTKTVGDDPFILAVSGAAEGSEVTYSSSDPDIASVDPVTGEVTVWKAGTVTITATAAAVGFYPKAETSCTLTVNKKIVHTPAKPSGSNSAADDQPENPFSDVPQNRYYHDAVLWAVENGITTGMGDGTFAPDAACTRAQVVTFLWRAAGSPAASAANPFSDVADSAYYAAAVRWAVENSITTGVTAETFCPDAPCTRGQIVTFLWRFLGKAAADAASPFADVASGAYCYDAVNWAAASGITTGVTAGTFAPDAACTRGQIVTFLYRAMK